MKESLESKGEAILAPFQSGRWHYQGRKKNGELAMEAVLRQEGFEDIREHSEYKKFVSAEIQGPFYVIVDERSTGGSLPHGDACYLDEWDVILVRWLEPDKLTREGLTRESFTILAHEMGHRLAHQRGLAKYHNAPDFDTDEDELLAWQIAVDEYGAHKKFDHADADEYIKSHKKYLEEKAK